MRASRLCTSYYPSLSIVNGLYPEHLGDTFCAVYQSMFEERKKYPKSDPNNGALKLALNGSYGASNNKYSPLFDPKFTMAITINGQLSLCLLAEWLMTIGGLRMLQINTDGLTVRMPRSAIPEAEKLIADWERLTKLEMERADYKEMHIRDVNNYIAVGTDGKVKRKGTYMYGKDLQLHQNHSQQIVARAAEAALVHGKDIESFIRSEWTNGSFNDFVCISKVPRSSKLFWGDEKVQNIVRYVVSTDGRELVKHMPPLKDKVDWRQMAIKKGYTVTLCNDYRVSHPSSASVNFDYYIDETKKIVEIMK